MRQNGLQVWHRCGTCGTIFSNLQELRSHLQQHSGPKSPMEFQEDSNLEHPGSIAAEDARLNMNVRRVMVGERLNGGKG